MAARQTASCWRCSALRRAQGAGRRLTEGAVGGNIEPFGTEPVSAAAKLFMLDDV